MKEHEYIYGDYDRYKVIFWISFFSIIISLMLAGKLDCLGLNNLKYQLKINISMVSIYTVLLFILSKIVWKWKVFGKIFNFPNLNGEYKVDGESVENSIGNQINWNGKIIIKQTWSKILITLQSENSKSISASYSAVITYISGVGYKLEYNYMNTPNQNSNDLNMHTGNAQILFTKSDKYEGAYYNNFNQRKSYGIMHLTRIN
ncbi:MULTISPECIES: hypothetical protein [unclassified Clostridium]|uniref:Cap15 family cyclic dinucleotide receptor domain-containing protein n=1 Tax=unclassified Clostridium TaxID=2614128 RepID=UPI0013FAD193|nr:MULTISPECIES: hypothetical protein [unclassified Clostridium]MBN1038260.1 hypothetical protein [Clostridium botulinum]NFR86169.1 hypothetical protein [Clostridium botulinum]NFR88919.1 hypothetical protein [Clostridium botulinum]NFT98740.1 hypothetical protein [Clostridium botulinum]